MKKFYSAFDQAARIWEGNAKGRNQGRPKLSPIECGLALLRTNNEQVSDF